MKILYNKEDNEYYLISNNENEFYLYDDEYFYANSLKNLLKK